MLVTNASKIVAQAGVKRIGQICSTERGLLVTMLDLANAADEINLLILFFQC